ncbi:hypothetical protein MRB53_026034 [Persea americana]|uniref:Uncharacterized protein n=1 Tax=Persea americana TaxID=3435 RepID=A0ACC2LHU7_PERAE|nr:hypothetical protein MRB53_026034 [Persea americana]
MNWGTCLGQKAVLGEKLCDFGREDDVPMEIKRNPRGKLEIGEEKGARSDLLASYSAIVGGESKYCLVTALSGEQLQIAVAPLCSVLQTIFAGPALRWTTSAAAIAKHQPSPLSIIFCLLFQRLRTERPQFYLSVSK